MKDDKLRASLEEVAAQVGIPVTYEKIKKTTGRQPKGGLCYVHDEPRIIVHRFLNEGEKIQVLIEALRDLDLENLFIQPEVRQAIEGVKPLISKENEA
jgi:hypothetical protein